LERLNPDLQIELHAVFACKYNQHSIYRLLKPMGIVQQSLELCNSGLCSILPIVLVILACRKYDQLKDSESAETKKWGVSMEGIKMPRVLPLDLKSASKYGLNDRHRLSKPVAINVGHLSFLKEFLLVMTFVFFRHSPWF
jgi:hypothetical protein